MDMSAKGGLSVDPVAGKEGWTGKCVCALVALTLLVFGPVCLHPFSIWDDELFVNKPALAPPTLAGLAKSWAGPQEDLYVPVVQTVWWGLAHLFPLETGGGGTATNPLVFHTASVIAHAVNVVLVLLLLRSLVGALWPAAVGAAIFAVHPSQVETVAWASELKDLLSGTFTLLALLVYAHGARRSERGVKGEVGWWLASCGALMTAGILCKPSALMVPALGGLMDVLVLRRAWKAAACWVGVLLVAAMPWVVVGKMAQQGIPSLAPPWPSRFLVVADASGFYLRHAVWPAVVVPDYSHFPQRVLGWPWTTHAVATCVVLAAVITVWWQWRRRRLAACGLAFFMIAPLPVLGFVPFDFQMTSTVADHYMYVALVGAGLVVAGAWPRRWTYASGVVAAVMVGALGVRAAVQVDVWRSDVTLWGANLRAVPGSSLSYVNYSAAAMPNDFAGQVVYLEKSLEIFEPQVFAHEKLAILLALLDRREEAIVHMKRVIELEEAKPGMDLPRHRASCEALGQYLMRAGHPADAEIYFRKALQGDEGNAVVRRELAEAQRAAEQGSVK